MYLSVGAFACVGKCRSYGAQFASGCVYPGFHFGLCPHCTLGYAGVSCLKALIIRLNFDAHRNSSINEEKIAPAFPKVKTSAKSVQTTRVVCTNFSRSLYRLQLKFAKGYAHARI